MQMGHNHAWRLALILLLFQTTWAANTTTVLHSFSGGSDGGNPAAALTFDSAGNAYGTTVVGGDFGYGAAFQLTPSGSGWIETVLYSFTGTTDGKNPYGGVTLDGAGNLYGTTVAGGNSVCAGDGCGVVYKLTNSGGVWNQSVLYNFQGGKDGAGPGGVVVFDSAGNLYGTTPDGGAQSMGTVYQLVPGQNGQWTEKVIHSFTGGTDGGVGSLGPLVIDSTGSLYGVTEVGGANGAGVAYKLTRGSNGSWKGTTLYAFKGQPDAGSPYGGLIFDQSGNLYGTTYYGGANGLGAVYELHKVSGVWKEKVLYSFKAGKDGNSSTTTLVFDKAGNLYGTASAGGGQSCGCGAIFKLTRQGSNWTESVVHGFAGDPDGAFPYYSLFLDAAGNFYGTTAQGGSNNQGTVFQFTP
jgi:uncharacterized repeat protein (TIGR03803 family)